MGDVARKAGTSLRSSYDFSERCFVITAASGRLPASKCRPIRRHEQIWIRRQRAMGMATFNWGITCQFKLFPDPPSAPLSWAS